MKLRNKKTGEIINSKELLTNEFLIDIFSKDFNYFNSKINKIQEEWEDYEEPKSAIKDVWFNSTLANGHFVEIDFINDVQAEKAVEKLKAWKRLKDKGFRFVGVRGIGKVIDFDIPKPYHHVAFDEYNANEDELEFYNDLMLLFGGEE